MPTTIYHNPRCSKSRASLQLLESKSLDLNVINYLETPPTIKELRAVLSMLGLNAAELVRKGEALYKELGLADRSPSENEWLQILVDNPKLIERPIVVNNGKAAIGRPLDNVEAIL